jgi:hypothetical protein
MVPTRPARLSVLAHRAVAAPFVVSGPRARIPLVFERLIVAIAAVLAPLFGSAVGTSRRNRLLSRTRAYNELAEELEEHNPARAAAVRELVDELTERLVAEERAVLGRRFEIACLFAAALFLVPAGVASYFAWVHRGWWTWPVLIIAGGWTVLVLAATRDQIWTQPEHESEADAKRD